MVVVEVALVRHTLVREEGLRDQVVRVLVRVGNAGDTALGPPPALAHGSTAQSVSVHT